MKFVYLFLTIFNLFALVYLVSPLPEIPPLADSVVSDEPGDTVQLANVKGYFTNLTRTQVMNFYKANYNGAFRIQLNHPPEKAREVFRDTMQSYYLEEYVLPFKQSLYINGFEWENDVFTKPENRAANKILYQGKEYKAKITIRTFSVPILYRLISFLLTEALIIFLLSTYRSILKNSQK
jgi:hypothetical protein